METKHVVFFELKTFTSQLIPCWELITCHVKFLPNYFLKEGQ